MSTNDNMKFDVDESNFVLLRFKEELDSLKEQTAEIHQFFKNKEGALKSVKGGLQPHEKDSLNDVAEGFEQRFQEEWNSLQAVTVELQNKIQKEVDSLKAIAAEFQNQIKEEKESILASASGLHQQIREEADDLKVKTAGLQPNKLAMLCFSGDLDKILASFILATGAASMGMKVMMFFSFWGCTALRKKKAKVKGKDIFGKMFGFMLPKGVDKIKLSSMHMAGMGTGMMKYLMKKKNVDSLPEMIKTAEELGIEIYVCEMSMEIMGMKRGEIIDYKGLQFAGAGKFLKEAAGTEINFFI